MNWKDLVRQFVPYGAAQYSVRRHEYMRLGIAASRAKWLARSGSQYEDLCETRLNLVPPSILSNLKTCVDAGAHAGRWTGTLLNLFQPGHVIALECEPRLTNSLKAKFQRDHRVTVVDSALAEGDGVAQFHQLRHPAGSSLLQPRADIVQELQAGSWDVIGTVQVPKISYDRLTAGEEEISILKLDIQGAEMGVLRNSREGLRKTLCVIMEVTFTPHYENDFGFPELHNEMARHEFGLYRLSPPYHRQGRVLYSDAVYVREHLLRSLTGNSVEVPAVAAA
ncbi:MAG TPA: FkbM family methyltransferase [Candidatus Binatia bacterium]|nr:FkbM family methyltransferase [Candidatus Binatia bacterium]